MQRLALSIYKTLLFINDFISCTLRVKLFELLTKATRSLSVSIAKSDDNSTKTSSVVCDKQMSAKEQEELMSGMIKLNCMHSVVLSIDRSDVGSAMGVGINITDSSLSSPVKFVSLILSKN